MSEDNDCRLWLSLTPGDWVRYWIDRIDRWWVFTPLARAIRRARR